MESTEKLNQPGHILESARFGEAERIGNDVKGLFPLSSTSSAVSRPLGGGDMSTFIKNV